MARSRARSSEPAAGAFTQTDGVSDPDNEISEPHGIAEQLGLAESDGYREPIAFFVDNNPIDTGKTQGGLAQCET